MLKTIFINTLKFMVAGLLIGWLLRSGKLDLNLLAQLKDHPTAVALAMGLAIINIGITSYRWKIILKSRSQAIIPLMGIVRTNWIGQFFSSVLPGSVSGDLVKVLYIQKFDQTFSKKFIFVSILIDRVMGLSGLILMIGFNSLFFSGHILENAPAMKPLLNINYLMTGLVILAIVTFFFFNHYIRHILTWFTKKLSANVAEKILNLWDDLVSIKSKMLKAVGVSLVVQFVSVLVFWSLIRPFVAGHMDFIQALAFIPLGLMTLALPVAPSGLGVGHAIFQKLFEFSGISNGASLFNLYFVVTLLVNVMGVVPYVLSKTRHSN